MKGSLIRRQNRALPRTGSEAIRLLRSRTVLNANALAKVAQVIRRGRLESQAGDA